jgi:uncharacterized membrane protein YqjE
MFLLIGLVSIITVAVLLQRPVDRLLVMGACGFALFTLAWVGMYFRLKHELPEHALVGATYLNLTGFGRQRRAGLRNMLRLIQFHFERRSFDRWSMLLIAGLAMLAASLTGSVL